MIFCGCVSKDTSIIPLNNKQAPKGMFEYFDQETKEMNHLKYQIEHEINLLEKKIDIEEWSTNRVYKNDQNRRLIEFGKV